MNVQEGLLLSCVFDTRALFPLGKLLVPFTVSMFLTPDHMQLPRWPCHRAAGQAVWTVDIVTVLGSGIPKGAESQAGSF